MENKDNLNKFSQPISKKTRVKKFIKKRKKLLILIVLILGVSFYFYFSKKTDSVVNTYTLSSVSRGSVFSYISGSGQVSSVNQIDIKPEVSGKITSINVSVGQEVQQGDILATIDNSDLYRKLIESQNSLAIAKNNLNLKVAGATEEEKLSAKISFQNAKSSYENAVENLADIQRSNESNLKKAEQDLASSQRSYELALVSNDSNSKSSNQEVINTYDSAKTSLDSAYSSLRATIISADSILGLKYYSNNDISHYKSLLGARDSSSIIRATNDFYETKDKMEIFEKEYLGLADNYSYEDLENLLVQIIAPLESSRDMMDSLYNALLNTITSSDFSQSQLDSLRSSASSGKSSMISSISNAKSSSYNIEKLKIDSGTSDLSSVNSLENAKNSLENSKTNLEDTKINNEKSLKSAQNELESKKYSYELAEIQYNEKVSTPDDIDLLTYRIQVSQAEANYLEAQEDYNGATIISPIDGKIAQINQKINEDASASQAILTVISYDSIAEITLSEVDVAKVNTGQKASLTFSAISDLNMTGEVVEVDSIGTTNQGVVSYAVKISLDVNDERIKPQMSVSVDITTSEKINVLVLVNSAVKKDSVTGLNYVEVFNSNNDKTEIITNNTPDKKYVEIGLVGDNYTEIASGLEEGDLVITKTSSSSSGSSSSSKTSSNSNQSSLFDMGSGMSGPPSGAMMR